MALTETETVVCHRDYEHFVAGGSYSLETAEARRLVAKAPDAFTLLPHAQGRRDRAIHSFRVPEDGKEG